MHNAPIAERGSVLNVRKGISRYSAHLVFRRGNVARFGEASLVYCFSLPYLS
ncbi:hypothetical protein PGTDC60_1005 [Porphyromonas gingivalis TDC60]|nr:hypothetical protein PGTDC60_1005 [Porphyromonas gingivalis TDC60]